MFRPMRRTKQQLPETETQEILRTCTSGVLSVTGDDGYPYGVPVSYVYTDGKIYFHCAQEGHKIEGIRRSNKVSFTVIQADEVIQKSFTTHYKSVIVFGKARILEDAGEKRRALECIIEKYSPDYTAEGKNKIGENLKMTCLVEMVIEHLTGKAAKDLLDQQVSCAAVFLD
jgi:uncharacterized protein